jgi:diacylglycerol kinase family enzyme
MVAELGLPRNVVVVNPGAGSVDAGDEQRLARAFPGYLVVTVGPGEEVDERLGSAQMADDALVVAVGGDGTVGAVARALTGTRRTFGIVPRGTFNNFARSLGIPLDFDDAIRIIRRGRARPVTVGRVNGRPFLEAAAVGLFGDVVALGEASKDFHYGEAVEHLANLLSPRDFRYRLEGDATASGRARSLLVANTPFTGARIAVAESTPADPYLELIVGVGQTRRDLLRRLLRALLRRRPTEREARRRVRRLRVETSPPMRVYADFADVGETPAEIEALPAGLQVLL